MQRSIEEGDAQDARSAGAGGATAAARGVGEPAAGTKGRRRTLALVAAALVLAGAAWWLLGRGAEVKVITPERGDAAEVVYATGNVEPLLWAKVSAMQRKRIIEICRCEGREVKAGDVLARLEDDEERSMLSELEARLLRYREDAARLKGLVERNVTARTTYDEKETQVREYEARVAAQKERIDLLKLKAPMDGIVLRRDGEVGEMPGIGTSDVLLWVGQPRPLRVVAEVNEDDIPRVRVGQKALLRHEGHAGSPLEATVDSLTPKGDPQTKTFRVYLALPDDTPLKVGMSVEANIVVAEAKSVLLVPSEALSGKTVEVVANGRAVRRTVEIGIRGTRMTEVRSGLEAGDRVVSPFRSDVPDGGRVRPTAGGAK
jgi:RND family efflux transporter MFP subunit